MNTTTTNASSAPSTSSSADDSSLGLTPAALLFLQFVGGTLAFLFALVCVGLVWLWFYRVREADHLGERDEEGRLVHERPAWEGGPVLEGKAEQGRGLLDLEKGHGSVSEEEAHRERSLRKQRRRRRRRRRRERERQESSAEEEGESNAEEELPRSSERVVPYERL